MKPSHFLKKVKLYEPLRGTADEVRAMRDAASEKLKRFFYKKTLGRTADQAGYAPNVLVVLNCGGIGNAVEGTPVVQGLRALWPQARITVVGPKGDLFDGWCVPDCITSSAEAVRGESFDHSFFPYAFLSAILPWRQICDLGVVHHPHVWLRKYFLKPERHYFMDMLKPVGYKGPVPPLYVSVKKPACSLPDTGMRICLVPGANAEYKWRHKRWPFYGTLADNILAEYPAAHACVIGTGQDEFLPVGSWNDRLIDLRGRLTLAETAWVLRSSNLVVGNDCGPMHIAYAVQAPSIVIFGPTCPVKNAPWGKAVAVITPYECGPCQYDNRLESCGVTRCMLELTPEMLMDKIAHLLGDAARKKKTCAR